MLRIEPGTFCMQGRCPATQLRLHSSCEAGIRRWHCWALAEAHHTARASVSLLILLFAATARPPALLEPARSGKDGASSTGWTLARVSKSHRGLGGPLTGSTGCTTRWFDRDDASGKGDYELLSHLRSEYPGEICDEPLAINVQTVDGRPAVKTGQRFSVYDTTRGFACVNTEQVPGQSCLDYVVQFTCPESFCSASTCTTHWFDRDNPSGVGDFEILSELRKEYPTDICPEPTGIEAQTVEGTPASSTGQIFHPFNPKEGFACVNKEQKHYCLDYKVRFTCPSNFCSGCTTQWFDRDDPSGRGDYELLSNLRSEYPGKICAEPLAITVQTLDGIPALKTGQKFKVYDTTQGFACVNDEQEPGRSCRDYRVQFTCPESFC